MADSQILLGGGRRAGLLTTRRILTQAELRAIPDNFYELLPASAPQTAYRVERVTLERSAGNTLSRIVRNADFHIAKIAAANLTGYNAPADKSQLNSDIVLATIWEGPLVYSTLQEPFAASWNIGFVNLIGEAAVVIGEWGFLSAANKGRFNAITGTLLVQLDYAVISLPL